MTVVDEGHDSPDRLAGALTGRVDGVEVSRVATLADAEAERGTADVVVAASDRFDATWVAGRRVCGSAVVATANAATADTAPAGVHAVLVLGDDEALAAQAAVVLRQLRSGQGSVLGLADDLEARRQEFLGHVSHELRTPLTAVFGTLEILTEHLYDDVPPPLKECLEISLRNCAELRRMVDDLLDAANADRGRTRVEPERMAPAALLREPIAEAIPRAGERGSRILVDVDDDLPDVLADPAKAAKIVAHLLDNAAKFSPGGSDIHVSATAASDGSAITVSVRDQGPGIDPAISAALFDPLRQSVDELRSSRRGLGLGLYLCKRLVEAHGGRIWAEPNAGAGTTFSFTLPTYTLEHMVSALSGPGTAGPAAVSCVAIAVPSAATPESDAERLEESVRLLRSAIRDRDLVATGFPGLTVPNLVGVLAACDEVGASAIEARLHVRLVSGGGWALRSELAEPRIVRLTVGAEPGGSPPAATEIARRIGDGLESLFGSALGGDCPGLSAHEVAEGSPATL